MYNNDDKTIYDRICGDYYFRPRQSCYGLASDSDRWEIPEVGGWPRNIAERREYIDRTEVAPELNVQEMKTENNVFDVSAKPNPVDVLPEISVIEETKNEKKDEVKMSLVAATVVDGKNLFVISDSRSTNLKNGNTSYTDDYKKIIYISKLKLAISSVGPNNFGGKTLSQVVESIYHSKIKSATELVDMMNELMCYYSRYSNGAIELIYSYFFHIGYNGGPTLPEVRHVVFQNGSVALHNCRSEYAIGDVLATEMMYRRKETSDIVSDMEETMERIISYYEEHIVNPTVGGPIQKILFSPDGIIKSENIVVL